MVNKVSHLPCSVCPNSFKHFNLLIMCYCPVGYGKEFAPELEQRVGCSRK